MGTKSYTEDDFKKILKTLLAEKKRVSELTQELKGQNSKELFHAKVEKLQNLALEEEMVHLKSALSEKEGENQLLIQQIEKLKAVQVKLNQECSEWQEKVRHLEEEIKQENKRREERAGDLITLQEQGRAQCEKWNHEKALFEKKYAKLQQQMNEVGEERELLQENYEKLEKAFKQNQRHFRDESEAHHAEIARLQEKLIATEHQLKQTDLAKVHEEYEQRFMQVKTEKELILHELTHVKQSALLALENKEQMMQEKIQEGHQAIHAWREKCHQLEEERAHFKKNGEEREQEWTSKHELMLSLQKEVKEIHLKLEANESELHKAQLHLAKKVKESALLQDVAHKQKEQILEIQKEWSKENERRIALEKSVDSYQQKEDQLKCYVQQCNQEAEAHLEELNHRCAHIQQEKEREKARADELEKYKEAYEKLLATLKSL